LAEWQYKAKNNRGEVSVGYLSAKTKRDANSQLRSLKLRPVFLKEDKESVLDRFITITYDQKGNQQIHLGSGLPGIRDLAIFTKQFALMTERGVPLIQTLNILAQQQKYPRFKRIIEKIKNMVENGATLSRAMAAFPDVFDELYVSMVRSGEISGNIDKVMLELTKFLEKSAKLRAQIKSASIYPAMILSVSILITYAILVFLVPVFAEQYSAAQQQLPPITQFVVDISDFLSEHMIQGLFATIGFFTFFSYYRKTPKGKLQIDQFLLAFPLTRTLVQKIAVGRFSATLSTMMSSGVSILDALAICAETSGNKVIEGLMKEIIFKVSQGSSLSDPLSETDVFPPMVVSMVAVGEQTGALDETLTKVSEIYEEEVDIAVKNMTDMFQPLLIIGVGIMLGFIVIALYLPIFDQGALVG